MFHWKSRPTGGVRRGVRLDSAIPSVEVAYEEDRADGKLVEEYDSFPKTDGDVDGSPTGGDVEVLLEVTKSAAEPDSVETTLRRGHDTYGGYVYESARHRDLMRALNLPEWSALYGFGDFKSGKRPKEIAPKTVLKTF